MLYKVEFNKIQNLKCGFCVKFQKLQKVVVNFLITKKNGKFYVKNEETGKYHNYSYHGMALYGIQKNSLNLRCCTFF